MSVDSSEDLNWTILKNDDSVVERNKTINLFKREREKLVSKGDECKRLLKSVNEVLTDLRSLKNLYLYISPRTSSLHSECETIIHQRDDLKKAYDTINERLNRTEEAESLCRRLPSIKNQIVHNLQTIYQQLQKEISADGKAAASNMDLYYTKFQLECDKVKILVAKLETSKNMAPEDDLSLYLEEIYTCYFEVRELLILPVFTQQLEDMVSKSSRNYCDLFRKTCTMLIRIIRNENQLYNQIFSRICKQAMNSFYESLCHRLYETLRPVILHINHLETLAEIYSIVELFSVEVAEDIFEVTLSQLIQDIQERMIFKTYIYVQESIQDYQPSSGDLAYPEKFSIVDQDFNSSNAMWYPTVQRAALCLFYLHKVLDSATFQDLAQDVIAACLKSLDIAKDLIDSRNDNNKSDANQFMIKHLVVMRDQVGPFPSLVSLISNKIQEVDPDNIKTDSSESTSNALPEHMCNVV